MFDDKLDSLGSDRGGESISSSVQPVEVKSEEVVPKLTSGPFSSEKVPAPAHNDSQDAWEDVEPEPEYEEEGDLLEEMVMVGALGQEQKQRVEQIKLHLSAMPEPDTEEMPEELVMSSPR